MKSRGELDNVEQIAIPVETRLYDIIESRMPPQNRFSDEKLAQAGYENIHLLPYRAQDFDFSSLRVIIVPKYDSVDFDLKKFREVAASVGYRTVAPNVTV